MSTNPQKNSYIDRPCERCGSDRIISRTWSETVESVYGKSTLKMSQIICTNKECQAEFDKNRAEEVVRINEKKLKKEEADKIRKDNIARVMNEKKMNKLLALEK